MVTQFFDEALVPSKLRSTQLVILIMTAVGQSITVAKMSRDLVIDNSTVTRTLKPLENRGLIHLKPGKDHRTKMVTLTSQGQKVLIKALPLWEEAEGRFLKVLGKTQWDKLLKNLTKVVVETKSSL